MNAKAQYNIGQGVVLIHFCCVSVYMTGDRLTLMYAFVTIHFYLSSLVQNINILTRHYYEKNKIYAAFISLLLIHEIYLNNKYQII